MEGHVKHCTAAFVLHFCHLLNREVTRCAYADSNVIISQAKPIVEELCRLRERFQFYPEHMD